MTRFPGRGIRRSPPALLLLMLTILMLPICGCGSHDSQTKQILRESLDRQAQQTRLMAEQNHEVAQASHQLVKADAQARQEIVGVHRDLQAERAGLDEQQNLLEADRRTLAAQRHREPLVANMLLTVALVLASLLPMLVAYRLLIRPHQAADDDGPLVEVLLSEMTSATPLLLTRSPTLDLEQPRRSLPPTSAGSRSLTSEDVDGRHGASVKPSTHPGSTRSLFRHPPTKDSP